MFAKAKNVNHTQKRQAKLFFQTFSAIINIAYHHLRTNYDRLRVLRLDQLTLRNFSHDRLIPYEHFNQRKAALDQIFQRKPTDQRTSLVTIDDIVLLSDDRFDERITEHIKEILETPNAHRPNAHRIDDVDMWILLLLGISNTTYLVSIKMIDIR